MNWLRRNIIGIIAIGVLVVVRLRGVVIRRTVVNSKGALVAIGV